MEHRPKPFSTARSAAGLTVLSALGPAAGLAVEMALAWLYGASATVDAFRIAALLVLFGQQVFIATILPHVVVPVFAEYGARGEKQEAWRVAFGLAGILLIPTALVSLSVFVWPAPVVHLLGPGLTGEARAAATLFVRWFSLTYVPLVWSGVTAGILYSHRIFWLPTASQFGSNLIVVVLLLLLGRALGPAALIMGVLLGAVGGAALHLIRLVPLMRAASIGFSLRPQLAHPGVRKALHLALPLLGTIVATQWSIVVVNRAVSELPAGSLATFGYAWKMGQLACLLPAAVATVLFPRLAEEWQSATGAQFGATCTRALRMALFVTLPLTCICFALRVPLVTALFQRGQFSADAGEAAARLFGVLVVSAPAYVMAVCLQKMFYATGETRIPSWLQGGGALALTASLPTATRFGAEGVAAACASVSCVSAIGLLLAHGRRYRAVSAKELAAFGAGVLFLGAVSAWVGSVASSALAGALAPRLLSAPLGSAVGAVLAAGAFLGAAWCLGVPEARDAWRYFSWYQDALIRRSHARTRARTVAPARGRNA